MSDVALDIEQADDISTAGGRLKHLRRMARLTRAYLEKQYKLPAVTLKSWENGSARLTEKGLARCLEIYRQEGIACSREWIIDESGLHPRFAVDLGKYMTQLNDVSGELDGVSEDMCMAREAQFFKTSYKDAVIFVIPDDNMAPMYQPGEFVGGRLRYGRNIETTVGKDCIIRLQDGRVIFRRLFHSTEGQGYNLALINPLTDHPTPVLFNQMIDSAAPVVWHRRFDN